MSLDLSSSKDNNITQYADLETAISGMSIDEMKEFFASPNIKYSMDGVKVNKSGEMVVDAVLPQSNNVKLNPSSEFNENSEIKLTAYPLKSQDTQNTKVETSGEKTWDIQTTHGPANTNIDPSKRTVLYNDENGDPVYSNVDGDYLYDDYNDMPVYYDTKTALANGADAIKYDSKGGTLKNNAGGNAGSGIGSNIGTKTGGTGAQIGSNSGVGTRLVKPSTTMNSSDFVAISDYAKVVNKYLVDQTKWEDNPLDKYTSYTYIIEWFCIPVDEYEKFRDATDKKGFINSLPSSKKTVFYQTGVSSELSVDQLIIKSFYGSNPTYRNVIFSEIGMRVIEPSGATLLELIKETAANYGYITMASMPYFLNIKYVGYIGDGSKDDGKQEVLEGYETFIPFYIGKLIPTITTETKYEIQGFPISVQAVSKEVFLLKTDITVNIENGSTLGQMVEAVGREINKQYFENCTERVKQLYRNNSVRKSYQYPGENTGTAIFFDVDDSIAQLPISYEKVRNQFPELSNDGIALNLRFTNGTPLNRIIDEMRKIISFTSITQNIDSQNTDEISKWFEASKTFTFIPETNFVGQDPELGTVVNSYVYKIIQKTNPNYIPPFNSLQDKETSALNKALYRKRLCQSILNAKGLVKRYDGYNTGLNDQVLNVKLDLDNLFYVRIPTNGLKNPVADAKTAISYDNPYKPEEPTVVNITQDVKEAIEEYANLSGIRPQYDTVKYLGQSSSSSTDSDRVYNSIYNEIYRAGGMIQLDLDIKGDPYWISNYALSRNSVDDKEDDRTCHFKDGLLHLFFKVTLPRVTQDYHRDPDGGEAVYQGKVNKTVSGIYMVSSAVSRFIRGQFTQSLQCFMNGNLPMEFNGKIINDSRSNFVVNTIKRDEVKASEHIDTINKQANNQNFNMSLSGDVLTPQKPSANLWAN